MVNGIHVDQFTSAAEHPLEAFILVLIIIELAALNFL